MISLFNKISLSTNPIRSLDIADESYNEDFSLELLAAVIRYLPTVSHLRYLGTLVLPVDGQKRMQFYGKLMQIPHIQCIELDVSEWDLSPVTQPRALVALAKELRLYCRSIDNVVFVQDFERTLVSVVDGVYVLDHDVNTDLLWRET